MPSHLLPWQGAGQGGDTGLWLLEGHHCTWPAAHFSSFISVCDPRVAWAFLSATQPAVVHGPCSRIWLTHRALLPCVCRMKAWASLRPCEVGAQSLIYRLEGEAWGESGRGALPAQSLVPWSHALSSPAPAWSPDDVLQAQGLDDVLSLPPLTASASPRLLLGGHRAGLCPPSCGEGSELTPTPQILTGSSTQSVLTCEGGP